jgi:glycerophosphoryl diester phosphodiesterase
MGALACAALCGTTPVASAETDWTALRTLNIAHQGGENEAPSNTMYAYVRALRLGADMLEVDIHTTADGKVVVMHDGTVDRTTDGSGSVYDMTLAELRELDAAYDFVPGLGIRSGMPADDYRFRGIRTGERKPPLGFKPRDFRIPTLQEVMRAFPEVPINIEIKGRADTDLASFNRNAEHLAALLNRLGRTGGIIVASFNDAALQTFHQLAPDIKLAPGIAGVAAFKFGNIPPPAGTVAFQVPIEFEGIPVTDADFVQRAHAGGYAVHVWTINDEPTMLDLFDLGVDGVMTAEPARLERVLCEQQVARPPRPSGIPGKHCNHRRASIACDVFAQGPVRLLGDRLRFEVVREDDFPGRCAGRVELLPPGFHASAGFDFGELPPGEGGPESLRIAVPLSADDREKLDDRPRVAVGATPYDAFSRRTILRL